VATGRGNRIQREISDILTNPKGKPELVLRIEAELSTIEARAAELRTALKVIEQMAVTG
jgi:hypothetical protein